MLRDFIGLALVFAFVGAAQLLTAWGITVVDKKLSRFKNEDGEVETSAELRRRLVRSIQSKTRS